MSLRRMGLVILLAAAFSGQGVAQSLSEKVINPIAFLMKFTVEDDYSKENEVQGEIVVPFEAFAKQNLLRIQMTLAESQAIDLVLFHRRWGTFGAGITTQVTPQTVSPGPAIGAVVARGKWQYGVLNQNFFSGKVAETDIQPILGYAFNDRWSAELGEIRYIYDWKKDRVTSIPVSAQLNRILARDKESIQLSFKAEYNLKTMWTFTASVTLIPKQ